MSPAHNWLVVMLASPMQPQTQRYGHVCLTDVMVVLGMQIFELQAQGKRLCHGQGAWILKMSKSDVSKLGAQHEAAFEIFQQNYGNATTHLKDEEESKVHPTNTLSVLMACYSPPFSCCVAT